MSTKKYGFWDFIFDCFMTCITCGFWLIWIFVREMRKSRRPIPTSRTTYYIED